MIPNIISHIWLQGEDNIPEKYKQNRTFWELYHYRWTHMLWDEKSTIEMVKENIPQYLSYIENADTLINKVNIIKYLNMYFYGGVYADLDSYPITSIDELLNEHDFGNIDIDSKISFRYPFSMERNENKRIGDYDIIIPSRNCLVFYPDGRKILQLDNPFLISSPKNIFWLNLLEYCFKRTNLKGNPDDSRKYLVHEPYGPYGLTDYVFNEHYNVFMENIAILPHYFVFSNNDEKYEKKYIIHQAEASWK